VEGKIRATCIRTLLIFGQKRNRSLITGVHRSKCEVARLPPSRAKVKKERTCPHGGQGTSSYLYTKHLQHIYKYIYLVQGSTIVTEMCILQK
jgi:hypothetical protein